MAFEPSAPQDYIVVENESGDILKLDRKNGRVIGCTVPFFMARLAKGKLEIPEIGAVPFNEIAKELLRA
jgi:hypothetical protein